MFFPGITKYLSGEFDIQVFFENEEEFFTLIKDKRKFILQDNEERYVYDSIKNISRIFDYGYFNKPISSVDCFITNGNIILERINLYDREKYIQLQVVNRWKKLNKI
jgi:hypothetical protein